MTAPLIAAGRRGTAPVSPVDSPSASPAGDPIDILAERAPDPSPPSPTAASVAASPPPATPPPTDRQIIQGVLHDYQAALNRLDPQALQAVWPDVDTAAYTRAFSQIERQAVSFHECSVAIIGNGATARCQGRASFVPKVGPRDERADDRHWRIELRRADGDWRIVGVDAR